jgi:DGQHR domain-containing protein
MTDVKIPCLKVSQHGRTIYVCSIPAVQLADLFVKKIISVDEWSPSHQEGYQRAPVITRARQFTRYITKGGISPTSILLYQRDAKNGVVYKDGHLTIPVPDHVEHPLLYLVDGQHRTLGFREGFEQGMMDEKIDFNVPISVLVKGDTIKNPFIEEAEQFVTINQTQKRIRTDLAAQKLLMIRSVDKDQITKDTALTLETKKGYGPYATTITNMLAEDEDSPFKGYIIRPNSPRATSGLPSQGQFEDSLLDSYVSDSVIGFFTASGYKVGEVVAVLKNYWSAIFARMPNVLNEPEKYYVTKTLGIHSLNGLLPSLFILCRGQLKRVPTVEDFKKVLKSDNFEESFWTIGSEGAGSYGGGKRAFKNLTIDIHNQLKG